MSSKSKEFRPFIAAETRVSEFSLRALFLGIFLGVMFGVGNAYLGLKVGTTVSASIPAAVLSMAIMQTFSRRNSILENNLVQTIASVGEALAAGLIFTVPALFILGEPMPIHRMFILGCLGGILGVLFMIPMRRYIIVKEHGLLPFPEGTACAEILKSTMANSTKAVLTITGIIIGAIYRLCSGGFALWNESPSYIIKSFQRTMFSMDCTPALLGVGFIVGPRIAGIVFAGGAIAWWVLIPLITMFGAGSEIILYPATVPVSQMSAPDIWSNYIRYIGAGALVCGGILSLCKIGPLIGKTLKIGFNELFQGPSQEQLPRTDRDISLRWLILGSIAVVLTLWLLPGFSMNFLTIVLLAILGFFFVAVTSLTVGIVGSTSNPASGMTITTLLITCVVFVVLGWTERVYLIAALTMGCVTNVAIAMGGTTSQDLKTGYLLGATPRHQQIAEIIGVFLPALAIAGTLYLLNNTYGFGSAKLPAPQGTMMALVAQGVIQGNIPFTLVVVGIILGITLEILRLPLLPFAIGLYLPLSASTPLMLGGLVSIVVKKISKSTQTQERGILTASGLVAGDACTGVLIALLSAVGFLTERTSPFLPDSFSFLFFVILAVVLGWLAIKPPRFLKILSD